MLALSSLSLNVPLLKMSPEREEIIKFQNEQMYINVTSHLPRVSYFLGSTDDLIAVILNRNKFH
jgi:hypothetical protein